MKNSNKPKIPDNFPPKDEPEESEPQKPITEDDRPSRETIIPVEEPEEKPQSQPQSDF